MKYIIGQKAIDTRKVLETDINSFADLSGDLNPVHIDQKAAQNTIFGNRIAHGFLIGSYISKVIGMQLPGNGTIYMEQDMKFLKPVYIGDTITVEVEVSDIINAKKSIIRLNTKAVNQNGDLVIDGYAIVKVPDE